MADPASSRPRRTAWARNLQTPLRRFLRTETSSAWVLLGATLAALLWVNLDVASYHRVWQTELSIRLGGASVAQDLRGWINSGLLAFFFLVVGLEARREFDVGELRQRERVALPVLAGIGGMVGAVGLFLAIDAGHASAHGWGVVMSTDTAFALGLLALVGPRFPGRLRTFILTVVVVDDLVALVVLATVYARHVAAGAAVIGLAALVLVAFATRLGVRSGLVYLALAAAAWGALFRSGIDPVVVGLAMGLLTYASPAARDDLERATALFRRFREQPTSELARSARVGLDSAISPNERWQQRFLPWASYVFVPLFALANAGISVDPGFLARALPSSLVVGIVLGYVVGKPVGILGTSWLVTRATRGRLRPAVGWAAVGGGGTIAGIGFTVSLLIASLAFRGGELDEAKLGVLTAALLAAASTWSWFRLVALLPVGIRVRALMGTTEPITDLAAPVEADRDHVRGPEGAPVTLVEYGDFECPYCGQAESVLRALLADSGDVRYVWRHLPLNDVHPRAQRAAEAAEAAARQGAFWAMHDLLLDRQDALRPDDLLRYAAELELDVDRFADDLRRHAGAERIADDVDGADLSAVSGTPTFFINGRRHHGAYDIASLTAATRVARARASLVTGPAGDREG